MSDHCRTAPTLGVLGCPCSCSRHTALHSPFPPSVSLQLVMCCLTAPAAIHGEDGPITYRQWISPFSDRSDRFGATMATAAYRDVPSLGPRHDNGSRA